MKVCNEELILAGSYFGIGILIGMALIFVGLTSMQLSSCRTSGTRRRLMNIILSVIGIMTISGIISVQTLLLRIMNICNREPLVLWMIGGGFVALGAFKLYQVTRITSEES